MIDLLETHWRLTPDEKVAWQRVTDALDEGLVARAVTFLASSSPELPSVSLFMATCRSIAREEPFDRDKWFADQRKMLQKGRAKLTLSRAERRRLYGVRRESHPAR